MGAGQGINQIYTSILRVQDRLKELVIIRGFVAAAVLTLSFLVITAHGIIGIGYVWLGVQGVVSIALASRLVTQANWSRRTEGGDGDDVSYF